jgi:peptidoglycan hydrolase CwlO-like protein
MDFRINEAVANEGVVMSAVYNPEADLIAEIERLELEARDTRRKIEHVRNQEDKRVLNRQLQELKDQIDFLRQRIP